MIRETVHLYFPFFVHFYIDIYTNLGDDHEKLTVSQNETSPLTHYSRFFKLCLNYFLRLKYSLNKDTYFQLVVYGG